MNLGKWLTGTVIIGVLIAGGVFVLGKSNADQIHNSYQETGILRQVYQLPSFLLARIFPETTTPKSIKRNYRKRAINILLVPGHDNIYTGTQFGTLKESDLNIQVTKYLQDLFAKDSRFNVISTRDLSSGLYNTIFNNYFIEEKDSILSFIKTKKNLMQSLMESGFVKENVTIQHNYAPGDTAIKLYGINKWANDNGIDISLHIHFNDYGGRGRGAGKYSGFAIYVPEAQFSNARTSRDIATTIQKYFAEHFPQSNLPKEAGGVIEAQELIALGSNGSQDGAALLLEYGYIYESRFLDAQVREKTTKELAAQTYGAIKKYFDPSYSSFSFNTSLLPHNFKNSLKKGKTRNTDVMALQAALQDQGLYPPKGKNKNECPINGNFGPCTEAGVVAFQEKYKNEVLSPGGHTKGTGIVGFYTINMLNKLYSIDLE